MHETALIKYDDRSLVPVIVQEGSNGQILMRAWVNSEAFKKTWKPDLCISGCEAESSCG